MALNWRDTKERYGIISRALHWSMAAIFAWQFAGIIAETALGETPVAEAMTASHSSFGALLLLLVLLRAAWALFNLSTRPGHAFGLLGRLALAGHLALYLLMIVVPTLALVRAYGSGRGFSAFGLQIFSATGTRVDALMAPARALHGPLAWLLLALIAGHVLMVLVHRYLLRDGTLGRMAGRAPA